MAILLAPASSSTTRSTVPTGVERIEHVTIMPANEAVYDLQGRRVSESQMRKGLYIKNGRKIIIR
jgi:hypothetical protein